MPKFPIHILTYVMKLNVISRLFHAAKMVPVFCSKKLDQIWFQSLILLRVQAFLLLFPRKSPARAQTYAPRSVFYGLLSRRLARRFSVGCRKTKTKVVTSEKLAQINTNKVIMNQP